jgi:hypothetical protein
MLSNWAELYAKLIDLTGLIFRKLFCHKEFCIFASQIGTIIFLFRRDGQAGWLGKDAGPSIRLSKSAATPAWPGAQEGRKDVPVKQTAGKPSI